MEILGWSLALIKMGNEIPYNDVPEPDCPLEAAPPTHTHSMLNSMLCSLPQQHCISPLPWRQPLRSSAGIWYVRKKGLPGQYLHCLVVPNITAHPSGLQGGTTICLDKMWLLGYRVQQEHWDQHMCATFPIIIIVKRKILYQRVAPHGLPCRTCRIMLELS